MKKAGFAILALFISFSVNAANSTDLNSAIEKSIEKQTNNTPNPGIVYGGKDISRSIVAAAHESTWTKQSVLIG
ncbi:MAG TPA: hypothetical protein VLI69_06750 [Gammaproteobacteria bacterium]|nr:hypothetical protein [Gammaproteobacteria bacterium]